MKQSEQCTSKGALYPDKNIVAFPMASDYIACVDEVFHLWGLFTFMPNR